MSEPFAGFDSCVRISYGLVYYFHFHFVYADAGYRMVWHIEVASERTKLFELDLVDDDSFLESH